MPARSVCLRSSIGRARKSFLGSMTRAGAKPIIFSNHERVAEFPFSEGQIDIDMAADYEKLRLSEDST